MSSAGRRAWLVAASIGAVEALKDQGFCRWNYGIRVLQQHADNSLSAYRATAKKPIPAPTSSSMVLNKTMAEERMKKSEESFKKVMYLSCWGPN